MIAVVDYGMGNLRSVEKALQHVGGDARVTADPETVRRAEKIVLPGVGAFDQAVRELKSRALFDVVASALRGGVSYLGLCLGLQLLFEGSDEGGEKGFGIFRGRVKRFSDGLKVPHMGWNRVEFADSACPYWRGLASGAYFYFVHSYYAEPGDASVAAAKTSYGPAFVSAVWRGNIFATQFHPEKSQEHGLRLLKNFVEN